MSHLFWGGADCVELARRYGTPLYVFDETEIRARCAEVRNDFLHKWPDTAACYASKAFLSRSMARIVAQEGLGLDVVSGGELDAALKADFPPRRIELHGNAKSEQELREALAAGVGRIVVDGQMELEVLAEIAESMGKRAEILLRVAPGVNPHTHAYITTGQKGSKFGFPIEGDYLLKAVSYAMSKGSLDLRGLHFHIGSEIHETDAYILAIKRIVKRMLDLKNASGFVASELNFGGGFGVMDTPYKERLPIKQFMEPMMTTLLEECAAYGLARPFVTIEPGRWIISEAGITLYRVDTVKTIPGVTYVAVNGGMADNPRPSLYQAQYQAVLANKFDETPSQAVTLAGKCCETGDIIIESVKLPPVERGDIVAVYNTGAYNFSMSSCYNRLPRPAVVLVKDGQSDVVVAGDSYDDMLRGDTIPERLTAVKSEE